MLYREAEMPTETFAPYAPAKSILQVIDRFRDVGLPDPLTLAVLDRIGIPESMASRTLQALRFLGLIDEGGNRMPSFTNLRTARTEELAGLLAEIVRAAYLPVFTVVNPATDSDTAIADAFRGYEPASQREKMISLFRALCVRAEIIGVKPRRGTGAPKKPVGGARSKASTRNGDQEPPATEGDREPSRPADDGLLDIRLITAIIQQLPRERRWSAGRRERWLAAMNTAVDLLVEVADEERAGGQ